jgi:hypothetical protein
MGLKVAVSPLYAYSSPIPSKNPQTTIGINIGSFEEEREDWKNRHCAHSPYGRKKPPE